MGRKYVAKFVERQYKYVQFHNVYNEDLDQTDLVADEQYITLFFSSVEFFESELNERHFLQEQSLVSILNHQTLS